MCNLKTFFLICAVITTRKRNCGKVMFLQVPVILFTGWVGGAGIPACIAGHPGGKLRGLAWGVSRPTPRGKLRGLAGGGLQAHTQGVSWPTPEVSQHALRQTAPQQTATATSKHLFLTSENNWRLSQNVVYTINRSNFLPSAKRLKFINSFLQIKWPRQCPPSPVFLSVRNVTEPPLQICRLPTWKGPQFMRQLCH